MLFYFIEPFTDSQSAINLMICCNKYADTFKNNDIELLKFWQYMYTKNFGRIMFKNMPKSQKFKPNQLQLQSYKTWKDAFYEKYDYFRCEKNKLYIERYKNEWVRYESNMIYIVTKHICRKKDLLKMENFLYSNWYQYMRAPRRKYDGYANISR